MAVNYNPNSVTSGLTTALDATDKVSFISGSTTWNDLSGNNHSGTMTTGTMGTVSGSDTMAFNGSSDFVTVATMSDSTTLSVEMWINRGNDTARQFLFNSGDVDINIDVGHSNGMRINRNNANHPRYTNPSIGEWTHIVTTAPDKSTDPSVYFNGSLQSGTGADFGGILSSGSFLGNYGGGHISNVYTGLMSVFKVYDRVLSAEEVSQNFNAQRSRFGV